MNWKLILFFIVAVLTILYLEMFWVNRKERVHIHIFKQKVDMSLGLLALGIFLDGAILAALLIWLLA